jgi:hypothetical protein
VPVAKTATVEFVYNEIRLITKAVRLLSNPIVMFLENKICFKPSKIFHGTSGCQ